MKHRLAASLACTLLAALPLAAATPFEGRVTFKLHAAQAPGHEMRFAIKGARTRIEMPNQQGMGAMILDQAKREQLVLMDQQKMYVAMAMAEPGQAGSGAGKGAEPALTKTGETEKILGYAAEKYVVTDQNQTTELWLTQDLGTFVPFGGGNPMAGGRGGRPAPQSWERALAGKDFFPLRVVSRDAAKKEVFRLEATSVEKQALPDTLFAPPADYRKLDMGGMMLPPGAGR